MRTALILNLGALGLLLMGGVVAMFFEVERVNASMQDFPRSLVIIVPLVTFGLSALYLLLQSWVMLLRSWKTREGGENLRLLVVLLFFNFLASYYFYRRRYEIDPLSP